MPEYELLLQHISKRVGLSLELSKEVTNRRGAAMLKLTTGDAAFGLKIATANATGASIFHEAEMMQALLEFTSHLYVDSGIYTTSTYPTDCDKDIPSTATKTSSLCSAESDADTHWLLMKWISGNGAYSHIKQLREDLGESGEKDLLAFITCLFSKVGELHDLGFLHGDLQPAHFRVDTGGTLHLIDFALTHGIDEPFSYPGAFVHFSAPEICTQQLNGDSVVYDEVAELYSLGSVVFFLLTGEVSADYGPNGMKNLNLEQKRERIAQGHRKSLTDFKGERFGAMVEILERCLASDRAERYSNVAAAVQDLRATVQNKLRHARR